MALPKGPVTIQVSPSTYFLITKLIELGVDYPGGGSNIGWKTGVLTAIDNLFNAIVPAGPDHAAIVAELQTLRNDGFSEANATNLAAGSEQVLTC